MTVMLTDFLRAGKQMVESVEMIPGPPHPVISPMVLFLLWSIPGKMDLMDTIIFAIQQTLRSGDYASGPLLAKEPLVRATSRQPQN